MMTSMTKRIWSWTKYTARHPTNCGACAAEQGRGRWAGPQCRAVFGALVLVACLWGSAAAASPRRIQVDGRNYRDLLWWRLLLVCRATGSRHWIYRLKSRWTTWTSGRGKLCHLNQMPVHLGFPTVHSAGRLYVAEADVRHALQPILTPQVFPQRPGLERIVIDPGHGGKDSGACNQSLGQQEKELALDVAHRLTRLLEALGYEVVLTRSKDRYLPLAERTRVANRARADLFISLHFNAAASSAAAGLETFALTPQYQASSKYAKPGARDRTRYRGNDQDTWNTLAGYHLQRALVAALGGPDRGLKRALSGAQGARMPRGAGRIGIYFAPGDGTQVALVGRTTKDCAGRVEWHSCLPQSTATYPLIVYALPLHSPSVCHRARSNCQ